MKKFNTGFRGYDKEEVNVFVSDVAKKYEEMLNSLKNRDNEIRALQEKVEKFEHIEQSLNKALLVAEEASHQLKRTAREESNLIIEEAKQNASRIVNNALLKAEKIELQADTLKRRVSMYRRRARQIIEEELVYIDTLDDVEM